MPTGDQLPRWRAVLGRLVAGPAPRGEEFDLCRQIITAAPDSDEAVAAVRMLLEGAMADAVTDVRDAQEVMAILRAAGQGRLAVADLLGSS